MLDLLNNPGALILLVPLILLILSGFFVVKQQTAAVVERLGKFHSIKWPGLHFKIPVFDRIAGRVNIKIQQLDVIVETKTFDDVFVKMKVSVQFLILFGIIKALVTDIDPDQLVKESMNRINAAEREKIAAEYDGEAERIRIVAKAKAEAESKRLQGQGIADQRREIARGLEESVEVLNNAGINSQEASALIVITQHYDTMQAMGESTNSNLILLPNSPTAASDMLTQLVTSFAASEKMGQMMEEEDRQKQKNKLLR